MKLSKINAGLAAFTVAAMLAGTMPGGILRIASAASETNMDSKGDELNLGYFSEETIASFLETVADESILNPYGWEKLYTNELYNSWKLSDDYEYGISTIEVKSGKKVTTRTGVVSITANKDGVKWGFRRILPDPKDKKNKEPINEIFINRYAEKKDIESVVLTDAQLVQLSRELTDNPTAYGTLSEFSSLLEKAKSLQEKANASVLVKEWHPITHRKSGRVII